MTTHLKTRADAGQIVRGLQNGCIPPFDGKFRYSLLAATMADPTQCFGPSCVPTSTMPRWMAHMTNWISCDCQDDRWKSTVDRYAQLLGEWSVLDAGDWHQIEYLVRRQIADMLIRPYGDDVCPPFVEIRTALNEVVYGKTVTESRFEPLRKPLLHWCFGVYPSRVASASFSMLHLTYTDSEDALSRAAKCAVLAMGERSANDIIDGVLTAIDSRIQAKKGSVQ